MQTKLLSLPLVLIMMICFSFGCPATPELPPTNPPEDKEESKLHGRMAESTITVTVKAPMDHTWKTLVDFGKYPDIFDRISSVNITKTEDNLVYVESHLKPQLFVRKEVQHTVCDVSGKPDVLRWRQVDGNFNDVHGEWYLKSLSATTTQVKYHLATDPGPIVPRALVSFLLHFIQREIVTSFAKYAQESYLLQAKAQAY
jgi:ribosome-associated toxin RatA of RatAB toxin-antitoxin module